MTTADASDARKGSLALNVARYEATELTCSCREWSHGEALIGLKSLAIGEEPAERLDGHRRVVYSSHTPVNAVELDIAEDRAPEPGQQVRIVCVEDEFRYATRHRATLSRGPRPASYRHAVVVVSRRR